MDESFYASGTFWASLVLLVVAIITLAVAWIFRGRRIRQPKIVWKETNQRLLVRSAPSVNESLRVLWNDVTLVDAAVKTITVQNLGTADLTSGDFDGNRPIQFVYEKPPVAVLSITSTQSDGLITCEEHAGVVTIGPGMLRKGETVTVTMLYGADVSGRSVFPLPNVQVLADAEYVRKSASLLSQGSWGEVARSIIPFAILIYVASRFK